MIQDSEGRTSWVSANGDKCNFSTNKAWKDWRVNNAVVPWCDVIWFSQCTPKHSFIVWLAILGRLSTQDRLLKWYPERQASFPLCNFCPDSHEHLFFECSFSAKIWNAMKKMINKEHWDGNWDNILNKMVSMPCNNSIMSILRRLVFAACIYFIRNERNKRVFSDEKKSCQEILKTIVHHVRMRLASLTVKRSPMVVMVYNQWHVPMNINEKGNEIVMEDWCEEQSS